MMRGKFMLLSFLFMIIFLHVQPGNSSKSPLAPALYVFGDSLVDCGNNNLLPTVAKANFLPYGVDFARGATGRFTNGKTVVDFIAEYLGLPFSPPYMSSRTWRSATLTGLNYASAACGILPETGNYLGKCLNLDDQIDLFQKTVEMKLPKHYKSSAKLSNYLSKSIFMISIGNNDYINNYLQTKIYTTSLLYSPQSFAKLLVDALSQKFQRLYELGARKVVMFEIGPIGCIPAVTRQFKHEGQCVEEINQLVNLFNNQLGTMLRNLTSTLKGSAFVLGHANWLGYDAITNPSKYAYNVGLTDSSNPCCITWVNGTSACIPELVPCGNIDKHYFWDGYHLTQPLYSLIGTYCIHNNSVCIPMNIKQLLQV